MTANIDKMKKYGHGETYEECGQTWTNVKLSCGCIVAKCISCEVLLEDQNMLKELFTKIGSDRSFMREFANDDVLFKKFQDEYIECQKRLQEFIQGATEKYNFPYGTDCNGDYFFLKVYSDPNCASSR
jgi:hypothetical protein